MAQRLVAVAIAVLFSSGALAGCIGAGDSKDGAGAVQPKTNSTFNANMTETPDGRGEIAAFKETNATEKGAGGRAHDHDYWNGQDRVVIYQDDIGLIPIPLTPREEPAGTAIADFNIPQPNLVFEGTGQLEILFSEVTVWPLGTVGRATGTFPPHPYLNIHVKYITAADNPDDWRDAGNARPDVPLVIPVEPLQTDMPHSVASLWLFRIFTDEPNMFSFNLTMTAVKGSAVADWPPHPDLYARGPERVIYEGAAETVVKPATDYLLYGEDSNWFYPERVISWGTDKVAVDVAISEFKGDNPMLTPKQFYLDFHNASFAPKMGNGGTSGGSAYDENTDGTVYHFEIPVDAYGYDSPYGTKSRWAFRMLASFDEQNLETANDAIFCLNCVGYTIKYAMKITAVGRSTAGDDDAMMDEAPEETPPPGDADGAADSSLPRLNVLPPR